jgi:hypothetical protein
MSDPVRVGFTAGELLRLKSAIEWLTGFYEGASGGRALPSFVHERLTELDERISQFGEAA